MNLEKICEALSEVDELGYMVVNGCAIAQLFYAAGKAPEEVKHELGTLGKGNYVSMFDGLLTKEYGMTEADENSMYCFNDLGCESPKARHTRVLAHYEGMLIECLILQSSCQIEEDCKVSEDMLIAQ